jgi:dihydrolipoamide dehydrogenase
MHFDLIIIGGGPAGYWAAKRASEEKIKTLLIEKNLIGGTCLNEGCIPSKILLHSAKIYNSIKQGATFGVVANNVEFNFDTVIERKNKIIKRMASGIVSQVKANGAEIVYGKAEILEKTEQEFCVKVNETVAYGKRLLLATGSEPMIPMIDGILEELDNGYVLTNREFLDLNLLPASMVILGAGAVGLEMASYYSMLGCKVTVLEMNTQIVSNQDSDFAEILLKIFKKKGVEFYTNCNVTKISNGLIVFQSKGSEYKLNPNYILLCTGRKSIIKGLGLENIGVHIENGKICINEFCRTNIEEVYAAGDVTGRLMLAHTAYRQADVCINNILGRKDIMSYDSIPFVIYSNPEIASVGETEKSAKEKGINYKKHIIPMQYSGRYASENDSGLETCEILVDESSKVLIGIHIVGSYVSEIIYGAAIMIQRKMCINDIKEIIFPHPSVSEIIKEGILQIDKIV